MMELNKYELIMEENMTELKSQGMMFRHKKSGARIIVLSNDDDNKVFSIGFRTPPKDNTGVPHIIEHSVLCGSKEFPSKDPFVELAKGSLNTFLNAMTYSDKTIYPIASCNEKDFQNLMHVYLDAVFYPNIYKREEIFKQEGWHYELESLEDEITYNGVVYNEMKGVYSSPEQQLYRMIEQSLFPDTPYGTESGGDPESVPDLTYEEFLNFHKKYYHPSNSYIYLYGDMDVEEKLNWIDRHYLDQFESQEIDSEIKMQTPFSKRKEISGFYSVTEDESLEEKTYLSYNVVVETSLNEELYLAFQVLEYVLLSSPGAPLKQAILDHGIGKDILSSYDNGILQPVFSVIAKNTDEEKKSEFIRVIQETLEDIVKKGIEKKALQAAINYFEFKYREADFGQFPKGLMYGIQILDSWLYDDTKPFIHIRANDTFALLKEKMNTNYFEKLIEEYLLDNPHSSIAIIKPQVGLTDQRDEAVRRKLATYKESLSEQGLKDLIKETEQLKLFQETPSTKEELEAIPLLSREDIDKETQPLYNQWSEVAGTKVLHHNLYTNGIGYLKLLFDLGNMEPHYVPYFSILSTVLGYIDTQNFSLGEFSNEVNIHTGGIFTEVNTYSQNGKNSFLAKFEVGTKVLYPEIGKSFSLIREMLFSSKLEDEKRLKEIIAEIKSRLQMKMNSQGHSVAVNRAVSYFSRSAYMNDCLSGIGFYQFIENLDSNFETEKEQLIMKLKEVANFIFRKENLMISYTADEAGLKYLGEYLPGFMKAFSEVKFSKDDNALKAIGKTMQPESLNEGFKTSGQVQYVARAGSFANAGFEYTGTLRVLKVILSYDYLWNNVRVKGGAYGCMCGFSREGNGYFASYRDPNLAETNTIYEKTYEYVKNFSVDERNMTKYIIGTISSMDAPLNPSAKGNRSLVSYLCELSFEDIQKERDLILNACQDDIRKMDGIVKAITDAGNICVIGNDKKIEENRKLFKQVTNLI